MPRESQSKYFWPASAITEVDMDLLYRAREASRPKVPITRLITRAIRQTYGNVDVLTMSAGAQQTEETRKEAA